MTRTIAYLRVSTDKQADKGVSLEAQQEKVKAYAALYDLELVEVITDAGASAKTINRPGLQKALEKLTQGEADALLVVKLDRLTRSVADLGKLIEEHFTEGKAALLSVSEQIDTRSAAGRLILNILASVSQWERETISERTRDAMQHKKNQGEYTGGKAPYGFRLDNGELTPDPFEQAVIEQARELRAAGLSLAKVAAELDRRGMQARNGRRFADMQIKRMVA
jgi:DNA invertase Pin-like site-specific DNA recombinase